MRMRLPLLVATLVLVACSVDRPAGGGLPATQECGTYPSHGDYTVSYEQRAGVRVAVLSDADFSALMDERHASKDWAYCVAGAM